MPTRRPGFAPTLRLLCAAGALVSGGALAQTGTGQAKQPCPDYGSFVAVDPGRQSGAIVARSYGSCAELPDPRPRDPIHIGAEVLFGGQQQDAQSTAPGAGASGQNGAGQGGAAGQATGRLQLPPPAPVWVVTPGRRR